MRILWAVIRRKVIPGQGVERSSSTCPSRCSAASMRGEGAAEKEKSEAGPAPGVRASFVSSYFFAGNAKSAFASPVPGTVTCAVWAPNVSCQ